MPALYLVCAPEPSRASAYIAASLATPAADPAELNDYNDHSVVLTGCTALDVNRWRSAATRRGRSTCVISLLGEHRRMADVLAWPRMQDKAVRDARQHAETHRPTPAVEATPIADQAGLFDLPAPPPGTSAPGRAPSTTVKKTAPRGVPRTPVAPRDPDAIAVLSAWKVVADGSCCSHCPLCGANVHGHASHHLSSDAGHGTLFDPALSNLVRDHLLQHYRQKAERTQHEATNDAS